MSETTGIEAGEALKQTGRYCVVAVLLRDATGKPLNRAVGDTGRSFRTRRAADREARRYNALPGLLPMRYEVRRG